MTEREALIAAIRAHPDEDTPRLVFADWLDEFGAGDLDRATVEFIRMSCAKPGAKIMPRKVYPWLLSKGEDGHVVENWKRLVPAVIALDAANSRFGEEAVGRREGRMVRAAIAVKRAPNIYTDSGAVPQFRAYVAWFEFHRGFVTTYAVSSPWMAAQTFRAVATDQPLAELHVAGLSTVAFPQFEPAVRELAAEVERLQGADAAARFIKRCR